MKSIILICKLAICILCFKTNIQAQEIVIGTLKTDIDRLMKIHDFHASKAEIGQPEHGVLDQWYLGPGILLINYSADPKKVININYTNQFSGRKGLRHDKIKFVVESFKPETRILTVKLNTKASEDNKKKLKKVSVNQFSDVLSEQMQVSGYGRGVNVDDTEIFSYLIWNINHGLFIGKLNLKTKQIISMSYTQIVSGDDGFSSSAIDVESIDFLRSTLTLDFEDQS